MNLSYVRTYTEMGRGLAAVVPIMAGDVIMQCELLVLSPEDTVKVNQTELQHYTFKYNETQDCLVLGNGELFNHSDEANIAYRLTQTYDGRTIMEFIATKEINSDEQLFIDYNADVTVDITGYTTSKSMVG